MKTLSLVILACFVACVAFTQPALAGAYDDLSEGGDSTSYFDGGSGSTQNTSYSTSSSVPDVGPSGPVGYYDEDMNYYDN